MKKVREWLDNIIYNKLPILTGWLVVALMFVVVLTLLIISFKWFMRVVA